ncbi:CMRF35-like molecule 1 [Pteronotus mesoamericanus]|uniref:CMRF35-like molecule 1 n=1 Tax=Pteronotus mesoamericanus TaxID=1884717 RepID=UPI0023EB8E00|nr:CMRF35-like molecule 1 [Pteronotus parnellii mesoamericanus]
MHLLLPLPLLFWLSGSSAGMTGPEEVRGPEGGSLTVQCRYVRGWETYVKYWCQGADWSSCKILVKTTGSEQDMNRDRVSIRDNQTSRTFTVTMEKLRREDTRTYWCAIERTGADLRVPVKVTVGPVSTTMPTTNTFTVPVSPEATASSLTVTSSHSKGGSAFGELYILLPLLSALLLLLLVAASLLAWRIVKRRKKAAGIPLEQALQPFESEICYANVTLRQPGSSPSSPRTKTLRKPSSSASEAQVEVEYVTMAPFPKEDIAYAALSLGATDQDPTYVNTGDIIAHLPSAGHEEPTYSAIRKP